MAVNKFSMVLRYVTLFSSKFLLLFFLLSAAVQALTISATSAPPSSTCKSGSWGTYNILTNSYTCSGRIEFGSAQSPLLTTTANITLIASEYLKVENITVGSSTARINLRSGSNGTKSEIKNSQVWGNVTGGNNNYDIENSSINGTLTTNGSLEIDDSTISGNVSAANGVDASDSVFSGTLTSNNGSIDLDGGSVTGLITSTCCSLTTKDTNMSGGATIQSGMNIDGGTIAGNFRMTSNNPAVIKNVVMTSGSVTSASTIRVENSTIGSAESPVVMNSTTGAITIDDSTVYGTLTTPNYSKVYVEGTSVVYGECIPEDVPRYACGGTGSAPTEVKWNFNEGAWTGATGEVLDASTNALHGSVFNGAANLGTAPAISGNPGTCNYGEFVGTGESTSSSLVRVPANTVMNSATSFSTAFWMKMPSAQQTGRIQALVVYGKDEFSNTVRFIVYRNASGFLTFLVGMRDGSVPQVSVNSTAFNGNWNHIAATYSRQEKRLRIYLNGSVVGSATINSSQNDALTPRDLSAQSGTAFSMGAFPDRTFGMTGSIDNVRFYNKELTSSEVNTLRTETGPCPVFTPNLSWDLNEGFWDGSAGEVIDYSGNNLSGQTMNSVTSSLSSPALSGDPGTCGFAQLNGSNRYIQRASSALLSPSATLTVSAWVRPASTPSELMTIVSKESNYEFHINSSRRIYWWWQDSNDNTRTLTSTGQLPLNQWTHVAIRYSSGNQRIFINGVEDTSTSSFTGSLKTNTVPFEVGRDHAAGRYFNGDIDEIRVYGSALSTSQILAVRNERKSCSQCFTEAFVNTAKWYASAYGSGSVIPSIQTNPQRLRLTTNQIEQATSMTFKRRFPAAGNKVSVEFTYYAWNNSSNNGADGIAVVLSNALDVPYPGSFGGSLGYAQRSNPNNPGFRGGWLGIGLDEFGNYSSATEGRSGGPGYRANAVAIRGSQPGYQYLQGTNSLATELDQINTSTPQPGHRYRISIDSTTTSPSQKALVKVERATNSLSSDPAYSTIIPEFDAAAVSGQTVPQDFFLSFTGSTGSNVNFHEIAAVKVCSVQPAPEVEIGAQVHHFEFSYASQGLTCESSAVTIKACANQACSSLYTGNVTLTLSATNGASWVGGDSVTLTNGQAIKSLNKVSSGETKLSVASANVLSSNSEVCFENSVQDNACTFSFADTGLKFSTIPNQVAGLNSPSKVQLQVVKTDTNTGACVARVTPTASVKFAYQCVDPVSCIADEVFSVDGAPIPANPESGVSQYTAVPRSFDSVNARTEFTIKYTDVGKIRLHAMLELAAQNGQPALTLQQQSNEFIVRPDKIEATVTRTDGSSNPEMTATGAGFVAAGENFKVVLDVKNREGDNTPNYGKETVPETVGLNSVLAYPVINGAACDAATSNCQPNPAVVSATAFTPVAGFAGRFETTTAKWMQVGSIQLNGKISDENYMGAGDTASPNPSVLVGRFYPHHFVLTVPTDPVKDACEAGNFSYMGAPAISLQASVDAMAMDGTTILTNYNSLANKTYTATADIGLVAENANAGIDLSSRLGTVSAPWKDGRWTFNSTTMNFAKLTSLVPDGPYAALQLGLTVRSELDSRNFTSTALNMDAITNTDCIAAGNCKAVQVGSPLDVRYGRLALLNAGGPEDQNLPITLQSQYWSGNRFERNLNDSCTAYAATNLNVTGITTAKGGSSGAMATGQNPFLGIFIPAPGVSGTATMQYQIPPALNYLQFPWNGGTVLTNPVAEAQFGRYRGNKRQIFWQERLN
jgi:MSHA biogenesis protein MshQ